MLCLADTEAQTLWEEIKYLHFSHCVIEKNFTSYIPISNVDLRVRKTTHVPLEDFVDFNHTMLTAANEDKRIMEAVKHLVKVILPRTKLNLSPQDLERSSFPTMIKKIIAPLSKTVCVEKQYKSKVSGIDNVTTGNLGVGTNNTWHGQPDGRIRGYTHEEVDLMVAGIRGSDGEVSDGATSTFDAKRNINSKETSKLIATNVISSFIEQNNNPHMNGLIPSLMMNCETIQISLYDSVKDLLFTTGKIEFLLEETEFTFKPSILLLIWLFINHRYVDSNC